MAEKKEEAQRRVMIICAKGGLEDVYASLILANGGVMEGIETTMFFTFWGLDAITKKKMNKINASVIGNPALAIPKSLTFGKISFRLPSIVGLIPGLSWLMSKIFYKLMDNMDIPPVEEFLEMITAGGGKIYACKAAVDMFGLKKEDLWDEVSDIITVGDFYEKSDGAQIIFT